MHFLQFPQKNYYSRKYTHTVEQKLKECKETHPAASEKPCCGEVWKLQVSTVTPMNILFVLPLSTERKEYFIVLTCHVFRQSGSHLRYCTAHHIAALAFKRAVARDFFFFIDQPDMGP
jgi:hypothetical protein